MLDPKKLQEKADILENNLYLAISKQKDPSRISVQIPRANFPDAVINKALLQLMPRYGIKPNLYMIGLRDLMQKQITQGGSETFVTELSNPEETLYADDNTIGRTFEAVLTEETLQITVQGTPCVPSVDGCIAKSFFDHKKSAGMLLKDGIINFKEINRYPIVNAGDKLFYIVHEKHGRPGISFDGKLIHVEEAKPLLITIGEGIEKIDDIDDETFKSKGYYLEAKKTGVVVIDWDSESTPRSIEIRDEVEIKRLDYSVGNIGTKFTCPISAKIGIICNGFKIHINGKIQADISEGAEIITNNEAEITLLQTGTYLAALKDIHIKSAGGSRIESEQGRVTVGNELIDSRIESPEISFERPNGLLTNNTLAANGLILKGPYFSGVNTIYFGTRLFDKKDELIKSMGHVKNKLLEIANNEKVLMGKLQIELKKMAKMAATYPNMTQHLKQIILATKTMDYRIIFSEMDELQKQYNTKPVLNVRQLFETLEKLPVSAEVYLQKQADLKKQVHDLDRRMGLMKLEIEGILRKGASIRIFCGKLEGKEKQKPDFLLESEGENSVMTQVTGTYSHQKGFEFIR